MFAALRTIEHEMDEVLGLACRHRLRFQTAPANVVQMVAATERRQPWATSHRSRKSGVRSRRETLEATVKRSARHVAVLGSAGVVVLLILALAARPWLVRLLGARHTPATTQSRS